MAAISHQRNGNSRGRRKAAPYGEYDAVATSALEFAGFLPGPALNHDFGFGVELDRVFALGMHDAEEAFFPAVKGKIGHRGGNTNVDAYVSGRRFVTEFTRGTSTGREQRRLIAVWASANEFNGFVDRVGMNQTQHRPKYFSIG
jgi:hypothetical protein